jgi:hypothetical protein
MSKTFLNLLLVALATCCNPGAWAQGEGKTLRQALASENVPPDAQQLSNLDKMITSGAELNDAAQFVIAYYVKDPSSESLNPPIFVDRYDRGSGKWQSARLAEATADWEGQTVDCLGSILRILSFANSLILETHITPSAGCALLLTRDLKMSGSACGWTLGRFQDGTIVYQRSEVHFAAAHPVEIALYNPRTKRDLLIFPRKPFQDVRRKLIAELDEFSKSHQDYCRERDDPCDPEFFDSRIVGSLVTDDRQMALAFEISYEQIPGKPSGPAHVVYVYRHIDDEARMEYREMLMDEVSARYGATSVEELVVPAMLDKIFARRPAS